MGRYGCRTAVRLVLLVALLYPGFTLFRDIITSHRYHHQVFINFRGEDLRYGLVSHLGDALERSGINYYFDKHEVRGKDLNTIFKRIEQSTIALAMFSERYAGSKWSLNELVKMMDLVKKNKLIVIPIFVRVEPDNVRDLKGDFGARFDELVDSHLIDGTSESREDVVKWRSALKSATDKMGLKLENNMYENDFIKVVIKDIIRSLMEISSDDIESGYKET